MSEPGRATTESLLRELVPHVLGAVMRRFGDFPASEDAVQEALIAAARQWPRDCVPDNPRGWLIRVASRRMTDQLRSDLARRRREEAWAVEVPTGEPPAAGDDDTLILLFMCCHSALTHASAVALTFHLSSSYKLHPQLRAENINLAACHVLRGDRAHGLGPLRGHL